MTYFLKSNPCGAAVPCGVQKDALRLYSSNWPFVFATRESEALGIEAGMWLGGKKPLVSMQNSGLMDSFNDALSLQQAYGMPVFMAVTWRGCPGEDASQHFATGKATRPFLSIAGIPNRVYKDEGTATELLGKMDEIRGPVAMLIKRGQMKSPDSGAEWDYKVPGQGNAHSQSGPVERDIRGRPMLRDEALGVIDEVTRGYGLPIVSNTGIMSRTLYERNGYDGRHFYMTGSMSLALPIGMGTTIAKPDNGVVVVDGDASISMMEGGMITAGSLPDRKLTHIVVNNQAYGSCSEEPTPGGKLDWAELARAHGYRNCFDVDSPEALGHAIEKSASLPGPNFVHARIALGGPRDPARPNDLKETARTFREYVSGQ